MSEAGNTILPITPKAGEDFGKYTCIVTGLKETAPDPIVTIDVQEEGQSKYTIVNYSFFKLVQSVRTKQGTGYRYNKTFIIQLTQPLQDLDFSPDRCTNGYWKIYCF